MNWRSLVEGTSFLGRHFESWDSSTFGQPVRNMLGGSTKSKCTNAFEHRALEVPTKIVIPVDLQSLQEFRSYWVSEN